MSTGERDLILARFSDVCSFSHDGGRVFTWETQDKNPRYRNGTGGVAKGQGVDFGMRAIAWFLLDELNIALRYDYVDIKEVVAFSA